MQPIRTRFGRKPRLASGDSEHYSGSNPEQRRLARKGIDNLEAYDYYLRGRQLVWRRSLAQAYFEGGRYEKAVATLKRRLVRKPDTDISRVLLAACYGHLGRVEEAQAQWREVMHINPDYSLEHRRRVLP